VPIAVFVTAFVFYRTSLCSQIPHQFLLSLMYMYTRASNYG
jgi:hypothetical protein